MSLDLTLDLVNAWINNRHNQALCQDLENDIVILVKDNIQEELNKYNKADVIKANDELKDMFTLYKEIKAKNEQIIADKIELTSTVNKLHKKRLKWGLMEKDNVLLTEINQELESIDLQLSVYNHVVNFNIPTTLKLYLEGKESYKLNYLLELYKFIFEDEYKLAVSN